MDTCKAHLCASTLSAAPLGPRSAFCSWLSSQRRSLRTSGRWVGIWVRNSGTLIKRVSEYGRCAFLAKLGGWPGS